MSAEVLVPADGASDVGRWPTLSLQLPTLITPTLVHRGTVRVESGQTRSFSSATFDPVSRRLQITFERPLESFVRYRLEVSGLRSVDGDPIQPLRSVFTTGGDDTRPMAPPLTTYLDVEPIFERCASSGCHGGEDPALGLDLSSPTGIRETAFGVAAEQMRVGTQGQSPWYAPVGLRGLARIDLVAGLGRPAFSYLLYKTLAEPPSGSRMPPAPAPALTNEERNLLAAWIRGGAPLP